MRARGEADATVKIVPPSMDVPGCVRGRARIRRGGPARRASRGPGPRTGGGMTRKRGARDNGRITVRAGPRRDAGYSRFFRPAGAPPAAGGVRARRGVVPRGYRPLRLLMYVSTLVRPVRTL